MPDNGIDFEKRFGKKIIDMDEGEKWMALFSVLSEVCAKTKPIPKLEKMFYVIVTVSPFLLGALAWWFINYLSHIAGK